MLIGFARKLGPSRRRERVAEGRLEIAQGHSMITPVERGGESTDELRQPVTSLSGKQRYDRCDRLQGYPLEPITKFLPSRAHRRSVSAVFPGCEQLPRVVDCRDVFDYIMTLS